MSPSSTRSTKIFSSRVAEAENCLFPDELGHHPSTFSLPESALAVASMRQPSKVSGYPDCLTVIAASNDRVALLKIADAAIDYADRMPGDYKPEWRHQLRIAIAAIRDQEEAGDPLHVAQATVVSLLCHPERIYRRLRRFEYSDIEELSEDELEAWAWGDDLGSTSKFFALSSLFVLMGALSFAVLTFGIDNPQAIQTSIFGFLGWAGFSASSAVLGIGLYRNYIPIGYPSWEYRGYQSVSISRITNFPTIKKTRRLLWAYVGGSSFLACTVSLGFVVQLGQDHPLIDNYAQIRLALLASSAVGLPMFFAGVWPVARQIIELAEVQRRLGKGSISVIARLITSLIPALAGTISFALNWALIGKF